MSNKYDGFTSQPIPEKIREFMKGRTFHDNPNITFDDLAYLSVRYYDFGHNVAEGELIVAENLAEEVLEIFEQLFEAEYEIEKIRLCDYYDGDDERSMADNNSSAFNYRVVADTDSLSLHALGRAIDINPLINPYIVGDKVMPANGLQFADRNLAFSHKIDLNDDCFRIFSSHGWLWGGTWKSSKDYQHFYKPAENTVKSRLKGAVHRLSHRAK
jgi:hypothetical protein